MDSNNDRKLSQAKSDELLGKIMNRIAVENKKQDRRKAVFFGLSFIISTVSLWPAFNLLKTNIIASGFMDYFFLIFTDSEIIAQYWQSFALSLLEVLPALSLAAFLAVIFVMLESLKYLVNEFTVKQVKFKLN